MLKIRCLFMLRDVKDNVYQYIFILLQTAAICVALGYAAIWAVPMLEYNKKAEFLHGRLEHTWYLRFESPNLLPDDPDQQIEWKVREITNGKCYSFAMAQMPIANLPYIDTAPHYVSPDGVTYSAVMYITEYFQDYFLWETSSGRLLLKEEVTGEKKTADGMIPILLGANYAAVAEVGDVYDGRFQVVGLLDGKSFWLNPKWEGSTQSTGDMVFIPMARAYFPYSAAFLSQLYVEGDENTIQAVTEIMQEAFGDGEFRSVQEQSKVIRRDNLQLIGISLLLVLMLTAIVLLSIYAMTLRLVSSREIELAMEMLCGEKTSCLVFRFSCPFLISLFVSLIATGAFLPQLWSLSGIVLFLAAMEIMIIGSCVARFTERHMDRNMVIIDSQG